MSKYKMVPVEPTPEMLEAGADWCGQGLGTYEAKGRAATAYKFMLAAAPDAQGEPVGWVWHSYNQTNFTSGSHHKEVLEAEGVKLTPVYTAPQPAEQQTSTHWSRDNPGLADQYRAEALAARRSLGFEQDAYDVAPADIAAAIESLTQPASEVAGLVEALEGFPGFLCEAVAGDKWIEQCRAALAAYRNRGGES